MGGEINVSGDGVGFMSMSVVVVLVLVERLEFEKDVALFDGWLGFKSMLGVSVVVVRLLSGVLCIEVSSSSELSSFISLAGTGSIDVKPSLSLFRSFSNASFLCFSLNDFIGALGCLMSGSNRRDGCRPFLFASSADTMNISGRAHTLTTFDVISL